MSDNGYVIAYRRAWRHPAFRDLLDAAIWNYLYQNAAWKDCREIINGTRVELKRGQIFITFRSLALEFGCSESKIRRLTDTLTEEAMIGALPTHRGTLITICNYDEYQRFFETVDALGEGKATRPPRTGDAPLNKEEINKQIKQTNKPPTPTLPDWLPTDVWHDFREMRRSIKAPMTAKAISLMLGKLDKLRQKGHDPAEVLNNSILNNWKDIYEPKVDTPRPSPSGGGASRYPTASERLKQEQERIERETFKMVFGHDRETA